MAVTITVSVTGTPTETEARGGRMAAKLENEWRSKQVPPAQALPTGNATEIRAAAAAYFSRICAKVLTEMAVRKDEDDWTEGKARFAIATDAQRAACFAQLPPLP